MSIFICVNFYSGQDDCPAGSYCPTGYATLTCPVATYSAAKKTTCTDVTDGNYVNSNVQTACQNGEYAINLRGVISKCYQVQAGWYVNTNHYYSTVDYCGKAQYNADGATSCTDCTAGNYCPTFTSEVPCPLGFYCPTKTQYPILCDMNNKCTAGASSQQGCTGTQWSLYGGGVCNSYADGIGYYHKANMPYLAPAAIGKLLTSGTETDCVKNNYCIYGKQTACPGNLKTSHMTSDTGNYYCSTCDYGYACYEDPLVKACVNSTRQSRSGNTDCFQCNADEDCVYRNQYFIFRDDANDQLKCPKEYYANTGDMVCSDVPYWSNQCRFGYQQILNSADVGKHFAERRYTCKNYGLYGDNPLPSTVQDCVLGTYTTTGFPACLISLPGYIMPGTNTDFLTSADRCPQGFYCAADFDSSTSTYSLRTTRCPYGTYARDTFTGGKSESEVCLPCPMGKYCKGNSKTTDCPDGKICEIGTFQPIVTCPVGFYFDTAKTDPTYYGHCTQCEAGYYCPQGCTTAGKKTCPEGFQCGVQTSVPKSNPTDPGTFIGTSGGTPQICPTGKYCPLGSKIGVDCPVFFIIF